jgi:hypothetical protein
MGADAIPSLWRPAVYLQHDRTARVRTCRDGGSRRSRRMLLPVIDAADAGDALLLVMPLADGALAAASVPLGEAEVVPVLVDIATGLQDPALDRDHSPGPQAGGQRGHDGGRAAELVIQESLVGAAEPRPPRGPA